MTSALHPVYVPDPPPRIGVHHDKNSVVVCIIPTPGLVRHARYVVVGLEMSRIGGEMVQVTALDDVVPPPHTGFWPWRFEKALRGNG